MNRKLMNHLCCPECKNNFEITEFEVSKSDNIIEGILICNKCNLIFPIINSIPRILRYGLIHKLVNGYNDFLEKYSSKLSSIQNNSNISSTYKDLKVGKTYNYTWASYPKILEEYRKEFEHVLGDHVSSVDVKDKLILDAGCGIGRFTRLFYEMEPKEIIGFDLSEAVVIASNHNFKDITNAYFFQGDILYLPLKKEFDLVYSIGVIHHTKDPENAVKGLAKLLSTNGKIFCWVYGHSSVDAWLNLLRSVSLKLPLPFLRFISLLPSSIVFLINSMYRTIKKTPVIKPLSEYLPFNQYADRGFANIHMTIFDHLSVPIINYFRKDDIDRFLNGTNLKNIYISARYSGKMGQSWRFSGKMP